MGLGLGFRSKKRIEGVTYRHINRCKASYWGFEAMKSLGHDPGDKWGRDSPLCTSAPGRNVCVSMERSMLGRKIDIQKQNMACCKGWMEREVEGQ